MSDKKLKVVIYSGGIPSTTFIERLINGLAKRDIEIYLFGKKKAKIAYPANVKVLSNSDILSQIGIVLKFGMLLLFTNYAHFKIVIKQCGLIATSKKKYLDLLVKYLPVAYYKPDIFHLQWANFTHEWMWVQDIGIKLIVSLRGSHINYSSVVDPGLADNYRKMFIKVDAFHSVSNAIAGKAVEYNAHNIQTVYSGLPLEQYLHLEYEPKINATLNIVSVGRWHWVKGYSYAIDAIRLLLHAGVDFHYTIIAGKAPQDVLYNIEDTGLSNHITILDQIDHDAVMKYITQADILLLPSLDEGVANVVLEAMAVGTIVLSTDCGGMREVISDKENGFIVPRRDSKSIADKIIDISKLSDNEKKSITRNARLKIEEQHSIDKMVDDMLRLYKSVVGDAN